MTAGPRSGEPGPGLGRALQALGEWRLAPVSRRPSQAWRTMEIEGFDQISLGTSFRPRQAEELGLDPRMALSRILSLPISVVRLGARWNRLEGEDGGFSAADLDWQIEAAARATKRVILALGAVKNFGYPEFYVPAHRLQPPLVEGSLVTRASHPDLSAAACQHLARLVERYRDHPSIIAWQVEHEPYDPLGLEHSWRLGSDFVSEEVATVRALDPTRPVVITAFVATSLPVLISQRLRTRGQGDSLRAALDLGDAIGIDLYPRHALAAAGGLGAYLDGSHGAWPGAAPLTLTALRGRRLLVTEGQAEPWESVTRPPSPLGRWPSSCPPEGVIRNYNLTVRWARRQGIDLHSYLFWGAEYWWRRYDDGDASYLRAAERVLERSPSK